MTEIFQISNSQIGMWLRCPRQWEFRYIKGLKLPPKGVMVQGTAYHGALKKNFENKIQTKEDLSISDILDAFDSSWNEAVSLDGKEQVDWEERDADDLKDEGANCVSIYHKKMVADIDPVSVEQRVEMPIGKDLTCVGYIDLETKNNIIDHKLRGRSMNQADADRDTQALTYCLMQEKKNFAFHVMVKKKFPEVQVVSVKKTVKDIEWWLESVKQIAAQIRTGICPPNPTGWWCSEKFCGYWNLCKGGVFK